MVPIQGDPIPKFQAPHPVIPKERRTDPVRVAVHAMLALYLMPVLLVVCLIGGIGILAEGVASLASRVMANRRDHRKIGTPTAVTRARIGKTGTRVGPERDRSRIAR